ncbi:nucleoside deaminase [Ornithinibacillus bavariensis]|uniref:nucleoside deaminase n=1 Tax=Ornithinibacillus bavariensis TaxID=545502 RepID=UPI003D1D433E
MENWNELSEPWKRCFLQAWKAYCHGSIPIGAVLVDSEGEIFLEGRNRVHELTAPEGQLCDCRIAHAEMNVLVQVKTSDYEKLSGATIYSTMEPCIQCFGAIILSRIKNISFAAIDDKLAGATTLEDRHGFIKSRNLNIAGPFSHLGEIQIILRTDFLLRIFDSEYADPLIAAHEKDYPIGVALGRHYHRNNRLQVAKKETIPFGELFNEFSFDIKRAREGYTLGK